MRLLKYIHWNGDPEIIELHLQNCIVYDYTALNALNNIAEKYRKKDNMLIRDIVY